MRHRLALALLLVATVAAPTLAAGEPLGPGSPTEAVHRHIEETIWIAVDPRLNAAARQEVARLAVARSFDFDELSRRALGEHWARLTATQRKDAISGVRAMVTGIYTSRMGRDLGARVGGMRERLHFIDESVSGSVASVTMSLTHASQDVPLQVALMRRGPEWRISDLAVDGVRLTDNLRAQVTHLSRGTDYGEVLERLRAREASATTMAPSANRGSPSR